MKKLYFFIIVGILFSACTRPKNTTQDGVDAYLESIKGDTKKLKAFFQKMPKGGDIHHHASGTPYAEQYIANALQDSCFIHPTSFQLYKTQRQAIQKGDTKAILIQDLLATNPSIKDAIIDNWSVRNHKERHQDGHDLFFSTFPKFEPAFIGHESALLSQICEKAAIDNISYIETMITVPNIQDSVRLLMDVEMEAPLDPNDTDAIIKDWYTHLMENGLDHWAQANADSLDSYYNRTNKHGVHLQFQTYALRAFLEPSVTFAHLLLGFKTATLTDNLVGVNFVAPEDNGEALKNYRLHMKMFSFLHQKFPAVNIALHAGELVKGKGSVRDEDLKFHITEALKDAKALRIGHGVDLIHEDNYLETIEFMKKHHAAVEINLESNEVILETSPKTHPIAVYFENDIPICIATDDEGVLRTNLTNQYVLLTRYLPQITYSEIKEIVFNSIKYAFLSDKERARLLMELEQEFEKFEEAI